MRVVLTEKPSVARDLARALGVRGKATGHLQGEGLRITWCFGHMAELREPAHYDPAWKRWALATLPMIPERFEHGVRKGAVDQMKVIRRLLRDPTTEDVVNACDAGREGELIFRTTYDLAGCTRPVLRLWISSLTDQAIRDGWARLRPGHTLDALADAARCRSEADWLVGLNATRALTCRARSAGGGDLMSVGRVQTPTLAMIVARDRAIDRFVPERFWQVRCTFVAPGIPSGLRSWQATWTRTGAEGRPGRGTDDDGDEGELDTRLADEADAARIAAATSGQRGTIALARRRQTRERPPLLYDLTALQRRANQRYGMSAQRTLELAQALYEKHKLITYPRTDARFITADQAAQLPVVLKGLLPVAPYAPFVQALLARQLRPGARVVNPTEVGDHHAILPTGRTPSATLGNDEKRIFDLVARRLLAALSEVALFDVTVLIVHVPPAGPLPEGVLAPLKYRARGRVCRQPGWRAVDPPGRGKELELPPVEAGDPADAGEAEARVGQTRPPKPYTDASILGAMETAGKDLDDAELKRAMRKKGLGTPATRAAILQTLLDRSYIVRAQRTLRATERGGAVIDALPIDELKSPELTGRWEGRLAAMADGQDQRAAFMGDTAAYVHRIVDAIRAAPAPPVVAAAPSDAAVLGPCPVCGLPVRLRGPVYGCDTGRSCAFVVFATMSRRPISARMVKRLIADGRTPAVKGFRNKQGRAFTAGLKWDAAAARVGFWFPDRERHREGEPCPRCGRGTIIRGRRSRGCSRWREGCDFRA